MARTAPGGRIAYYTEGDAWRWQLETLEDLTAFVRAHAPGTRKALPTVVWSVAGYRGARGDAGCVLDPPTGTYRDPLAVLSAYAAALGAEVRAEQYGDHTTYRVTGRIGPRVGTEGQARTALALSARVYRDYDDAE